MSLSSSSSWLSPMLDIRWTNARKYCLIRRWFFLQVQLIGEHFIYFIWQFSIFNYFLIRLHFRIDSKWFDRVFFFFCYIAIFNWNCPRCRSTKNESKNKFTKFHATHTYLGWNTRIFNPIFFLIHINKQFSPQKTLIISLQHDILDCLLPTEFYILFLTHFTHKTNERSK